MIEVRQLSHRYGPLTAVRDLSFTVENGEVLGLLGPNGAGKTTTLRAVVGLLSPSEGRVSLGGHDLASDPVAARRLLGYLPEAVSLYRELTVGEMLFYTARIKGVGRASVTQEVDRVIEACGLQSVRSRLIGFCSRGYRQRIGLAHALLGDPPVLVLDEPTVGLDPAQIVEIRERIARLAKDKAVILSTHILPEASLLCSRVLILSNGRCVAEDRPEVLEHSLAGGQRLRVVCASQAPVAELLRELPEVRELQALEAQSGRQAWRVELSHADGAPAVLRALVSAGIDVHESAPERLGLEAVFLELVRQEGATTSAQGGKP